MAIAGRLCYAPVSAAELKKEHERRGGGQAGAHPGALRSPLGSRARLVQLRRRRRLARLHAPAGAPSVASYNQQSQRYVRFGEADSFVVPPSDRRQPRGRRSVFLAAMEQARVAYDTPRRAGPRRGPQARSRAGGRPLRAAQRRRDQDRRHHERARAAPLLPACAAAGARSGRSTPWRGRCAAWSRISPRPVRQERPGLPVRQLPRGQDDLRRAVRARPTSTGRRRPAR